MKILLDEQVNKIIKHALIADFQIFKLKDLNWLGYQNGALRELLNENEFTFLITKVSILNSWAWS